jgi:hypothetical protein
MIPQDVKNALDEALGMASALLFIFEQNGEPTPDGRNALATVNAWLDSQPTVAPVEDIRLCVQYLHSAFAYSDSDVPYEVDDANQRVGIWLGKLGKENK